MSIDIPAEVFTIPAQSMAPVAVQGTGHLTRATISGPAAGQFSFVGLCADPRDCDLAATPIDLPTSFDITCTNASDQVRSATLTVFGDTPGEHDTATLNCTPGMPASEPRILVTPTPLSLPDTPVGMTSAAAILMIQNVGTAGPALTAQLAVSGSEFAADACAATPCSIPPGQTVAVPIRFTPMSVGPHSTTALVTSNDTTAMTTLITFDGTGTGGMLVVENPLSPEYTLDFGTIGRGQAVALPLALRNTGNAPISVTLTPPGAPFTLADTMLSLAPGTGMTDVTCSSTTPGTFTDTIGITSDAVAQSTDAIAVTCEVAPTDVQVTPPLIDFHEVRVGASAVMQMVTITNPSAIAVPFSGVRLDDAPVGLGLVAPEPQSIAAGASIIVMLTLATEHEVDLGGASLAIDVDGTELVRPIRGRVVMAAAHVEPGRLDLGTVCVGGDVSGIVRLVNDGSATLTVAAPVVTGAFAASTMPGQYPAMLVARSQIATTVEPTLTLPGTQTGRLTWDVDAPDGPFAIDLEVEFISTGTAVSPRALAFESTPVDTVTPSRTITLENCSPASTQLVIGAVTPHTGRATAWQVEPHDETTTLGPGERFTIAVAFAPAEPGPYSADLVLTAGGAASTIPLSGAATGPTIETTSFYACTCVTTGAPTGAWPLPLALGLLVRRRRRR